VNVDEHDIFHYTVSSEDFNMPVTILGIDTTKHCGPLSNIDLVHFVWEHFLRFSYKKRALALSPRGATKLPKLLFLKYYRAESDAWRDTANCDDCVEGHMAVLNPFHACDLSHECICKIYTRQPPSLADSAKHDLFNYTLYIDRFELTEEKTHQQYVYAVRSNRVPPDNLLPPEVPAVRLWYRHEINSSYKYHHDCPGAGSWDSHTEKTYTPDAAMIEDLISHKEHFWCNHCEKGLFFPNTCLVHGEEEEEEEEK